MQSRKRSFAFTILVQTFELPVLGQALSAGDLGEVHVDLLSCLMNPVVKDATVRDQALLVEKAKELDYEPFARVVQYFEQVSDPDGCEERSMQRYLGRGAFMTKTFDGTWFAKATLDPISGAVVSNELERLEKSLFERDWAQGQTREGGSLGQGPGALWRSSSQRRADALVEMAKRSASYQGDEVVFAPLLSVLVGYETLHGRICQLADGTVVTPGSLLGHLDHAVVERAVFGPGKRVEISAKTRLFTGATRRAIELRDQSCTHLFCDEPAPRCQVDHIIAYSQGGPTTQENGRLLCGFHNRLRNVTEDNQAPDQPRQAKQTRRAKQATQAAKVKQPAQAKQAAQATKSTQAPKPTPACKRHRSRAPTSGQDQGNGQGHQQGPDQTSAHRQDQDQGQNKSNDRPTNGTRTTTRPAPSTSPSTSNAPNGTKRVQGTSRTNWPERPERPGRPGRPGRPTKSDPTAPSEDVLGPGAPAAPA